MKAGAQADWVDMREAETHRCMGVFCPQSSPEAPGWPHISHLMAGFRQVGLENLGAVTGLVLSSLGEGHTPQRDCPAAQGPLPRHWHCWANSKEVGTQSGHCLHPQGPQPLSPLAQQLCTQGGSRPLTHSLLPSSSLTKTR